MKISIFGLGYVGAVTAACLARDGHNVIGVDLDEHKLRLIAAGNTPVLEEGMVDLMRNVASSGRLRVTGDVEQAISDSEVSLICVGTPSAANGSQDQGAVVRVAQQIGAALRPLSRQHTIVFRSTLVPGTVEDVLLPIIEHESDKMEGRDFFLCFQPEFLREGTSIRDYDNPPFTVVGASSDAPIRQLRMLYQNLSCEFVVTSIRAAEMVKYSCNNFHALKITFANEIARLCEALGVDSFQVMDLICRDTQLNISTAYLKPGFAFGGSCLPKDLRATMYLAKSHDVDMPMHSGILPSNRAHLDRAITKVLQFGKRRIGLIGLAFKAGTDDLRESPLVLLAEQLIGKGFELLIYDRDVHLSNLLGANRKFIEQHLPHISRLIRQDLNEVVGNSDVIVVGLSDTRTVSQLREALQPNHIVVDLVNIGEREGFRGMYSGIAW